MKTIKLKKVICRCKEELIATRNIANVTSWMEALKTFVAKIDIQIMNHNGFRETKSIKKRLKKKHEIMLIYFEKVFSDFLKEYSYEKKMPDNHPNFQDNIWVCWWQGLDNAPTIVKKCVESIKRNAGSHKVVVITEDNYKDYVSFPEWIETKRNEGIISRTHFSDLLRLELLAEYGGVWLDSTFFCAKSELDSCFKVPIWSIKRPDYGHISVACGEFANYSFGCNYEHRWVFAIIRDFVLYYWKTHDIMIDYLFLDYLIVLIQRQNIEIANIFRNIPCNNPLCDEMFKVLGKKYDLKKMEILKQDTFLFKLTWKTVFRERINGLRTFYGALIDDIV